MNTSQKPTEEHAKEFLGTISYARREWKTAKDVYEFSRGTSLSALKAESDASDNALRSLEYITQDTSVMPAILTMAEENMGELFVRYMLFHIKEIYNNVYHRPYIHKRKRDRTVTRLITALNKLLYHTDPAHPRGAVLEAVFSRIVSAKFQPAQKVMYLGLSAKDLSQVLSLNSLVRELMSQMNNIKTCKAYYDKEGVYTALPDEAGFNKDFYLTIHKILQRLLKNSERRGNQLGSLLEIAFSKVMSSKFRPYGSVVDPDNSALPPRQRFSCNAMLLELKQEIERLREENLFYTSREVITDDARKRDIVLGYSALVKKMCGARDDETTADVLNTAEPVKFDGFTAMDVARYHSNH